MKWIKELINRNVVFLVTGNAVEIFEKAKDNEKKLKEEKKILKKIKKF